VDELMLPVIWRRDTLRHVEARRRALSRSRFVEQVAGALRDGAQFCDVGSG
jgi:hypothetical protein